MIVFQPNRFLLWHSVFIECFGWASVLDLGIKRMVRVTFMGPSVGLRQVY